MTSVLALLWVVLIDVIFLAVLCLAVWPLAKFRCAAFAVLRRNFVGYFSNPTGYVFLCIFVLLTSVAAFWPDEFWAANLGNLDQLNQFLPYIMLVFIPAITMSIWAEEKRQGTDELLLTLPADDFDIVVGKYLAAAAIFTASLLFSQLASSAVLISLTLGHLDTGLLLTTYFGYWMIGLAMLAIGMVASFLTHNLTVGFILGAAFNLPLAFAAKAHVIVPTSGKFGFINWQSVSESIKHWSLSTQFEGFGRGLINASSVSFFAMIAVIGLYLSMVLIGKRHWSGGRDGNSRLGHYLLRVLALIVLVGGVNVVFSNYDWIRADATDGRISSLSPQTKELIRGLQASRVNPATKEKEDVPTVYIDAYLSAKVPENFVQTKYNLLAMLKGFQSMNDRMITVRIFDNLEPSSEEAAEAEERYGIAPQVVRTVSQGTIKDEEVILGAAFTCGLEKVVVPFFEPGIPVEYELARSISTVVKPKRGRLGVVNTDAQLNGGFSFAGGMPRQMPRQEILDELSKQYDIEQINASEPIDIEKIDVLMVVQPSSLDPMALENLMGAIRAGVPTAIFEDPRPVFLTTAPATGEPRQAPGGGMFGGGPPPEKGDIKKLWDLLGLDVPGQTGDGFPPLFQPDLVWQEYNPYPKLAIGGIPDEWVFASPSAPGATEAFNSQEAITSGLDEVLFPVPGTIKKVRSSDLEFVELVKTSVNAGTTTFKEFMEQMNQPDAAAAFKRKPQGEQVLAVRIRGKSSAAAGAEDSHAGHDHAGHDHAGHDHGEAKPASKPAAKPAAESKPADHDEGDADELDELEEDGSEEAAADAPEEATKDEPAKEPAAKDETPKDGTVKEPAATESKPEEPEAKKPRPIDVVYVSDIDLMISAFVRIRARPGEMDEIQWRFENVTFLLNIIDSLAGDDEFVEIRKRKLRHSTLRMVEASTQAARTREAEERNKYQDKFEEALKKAKDENKKIEDSFEQQFNKLVERQQKGEAINPAEVAAANTALVEQKANLERRLQVEEERLKRERDLQTKKIALEVDREIKGIQKKYKYIAVIVPPIPPLLVGLIVFVRRRLREREGISRSRLRF